MPLRSSFSGKDKRGWKTHRRGKHTIKPLPKNGFGTPPPPMLRFPAPVRFRPVVFLRGNRHRPGKSHFLRPPKLILEGALYGTFPPPQIARLRFAPHQPLSKFPFKPQPHELVALSLAGSLFLAISREGAHLLSASFSSNR